MQKKMGDWIVCAYVAAHHVDIFFAVMPTKQFPMTFGSNNNSDGFIVRWSFIPDKVSTSFPSTFIWQFARSGTMLRCIPACVCRLCSSESIQPAASTDDNVDSCNVKK